jgi:flagellar biosynthesis protein FlhF
MRLKTFTAANTNEALSQVREEMGGEAIVVATRRTEDGQTSQVVAALEEDSHPTYNLYDSPDGIDKTDDKLGIGVIEQALRQHGVPNGLIERLVRTAGALDADNPTITFAGAIDTCFRFSPLGEKPMDHPLMLVGPPGTGKSLTVAKLAARGVINGYKVGVITTDTSRAGAVEQLTAFTRILEMDLHSVTSIGELCDVVHELANCDQIYVDTGSANPYSDNEMEQLGDMIKAIKAEPVLVLGAGTDALEAAETAAAYARAGTQRLIITRMDLSRRLGSILAAGDAGNLAFSDVSVTPQVADGLNPINPVSLARIFLPYSQTEDKPSVNAPAEEDASASVPTEASASASINEPEATK